MRYTSLLALAAPLVHAIYPRNAQVQITQPSNDTSDLLPVATSPRFLLNGTELPGLPSIPLAPLGPYAALTKSDFLSLDISGHLVNVGVDNSNSIQSEEFAYISCDPEAYPGYLKASDALNNVLYSSNPAVIVILYSEYSNHCNVSNLNSAPAIDGVLTAVNPMAATALARLGLTSKSNGTATILPDLNSFTNSSGSQFGGDGSLLGPSPTTAVAMIILYSITGIITALFIIIIITGAIRAHRHPERYGPRTIAGRIRQSRAKGIARAMLETLPIVKFGDHEDLPAKPAEGAAGTGGARDIEMTPAASTDATADTAATGTEEGASVGTKSTPHDGTTEDGTLGCSICTEDFTKGEEVRVLPCNHKYHPDCVDPWLLNVSGTCPLCRIDLRPENEQNEEPAENLPAGEGSLNLPPPLETWSFLIGSPPDNSGRRGTAVGLRGIAHGTREERIAALRRYRQERRRNTSTAATAAGGEAPEVQAERRGLSARLRDRLRVRTTQASDTSEGI